MTVAGAPGILSTCVPACVESVVVHVVPPSVDF